MSCIDLGSRFWSKVHPEALSGCWLWHASVDHRGHGRFVVGPMIDGAYRTVGAHRHAYELVNGPIPTGLVVRHKCDVPACVNPDHLEVGTQDDNIRDRDERGRTARGEANGSAKLTLARVAEIRAAYAVGNRSQQSLAAQFGVSKSLVHVIVNGKAWRGRVEGA